MILLSLAEFYWSVALKMTSTENSVKRIESKADIETYIAQLNYSLSKRTSRLYFQEDRQVDLYRNERYTNRYTMDDLFPNMDPVKALKRELKKLTVSDYLETIKDIHYPNRSELRVFGKKYTDNVYIKIRVEMTPNEMIFVMSFHYAEFPFTPSTFPYK